MMVNYSGQHTTVTFGGKLVADSRNQLDAVFAGKVMEQSDINHQEAHYTQGIDTDGWICPRCGIDRESYEGYLCTLPWSTDRNLMPQILERIQELGLIVPFLDALVKEIGSGDVDYRTSLLWQFLNATPEQICRAALKAVENGNP